MISLLLVIGLLTFLFFLSSKTTNLLYNLFYRITRNKTVSISLLSLIIYPGVVIHELSHLITAALLFVPVKDLSLVPKETEAGGIQAGSVTIAKVDFIRRTIIGIAPLFTGIFCLWAVTVYLFPPLPIVCSNSSGSFAPLRMTNNSHSEEVKTTGESDNDEVIEQLNNQTIEQCNNDLKLTTYNPQLTTLLSLYLMFSIGATMYSSKKDLEALKIVVPISIGIAAILYFLGFEFGWVVEILDQLKSVLETVVIILFIPLAIQIVLFSLMKTVFLVFFLLLKRVL